MHQTTQTSGTSQDRLGIGSLASERQKRSTLGNLRKRINKVEPVPIQLRNNGHLNQDCTDKRSTLIISRYLPVPARSAVITLFCQTHDETFETSSRTIVNHEQAKTNKCRKYNIPIVR